MKATTTYDAEADAAYVRFSEGIVDRTIDIGLVIAELPLLVDLDATGRVLGIEFTSARTVLDIAG